MVTILVGYRSMSSLVRDGQERWEGGGTLGSHRYSCSMVGLDTRHRHATDTRVGSESRTAKLNLDLHQGNRSR